MDWLALPFRHIIVMLEPNDADEYLTTHAGRRKKRATDEV